MRARILGFIASGFGLLKAFKWFNKARKIMKLLKKFYKEGKDVYEESKDIKPAYNKLSALVKNGVPKDDRAKERWANEIQSAAREVIELAKEVYDVIDLFKRPEKI